MTGAGTAVALNKGSEIFYNEIGGLSFSAPTDTTHQKIAIKVVDESQGNIHDINVQNWTGNSGSSTTPSMGIWSQGREETTFARIQPNTDRPFFIDTNPDSAIGFDTAHIYDFYGVPAISTESCIVVAPGVQITHWTMDGTNVCALGTSALLWNDTTAAGQSKSILIENYHHEQSQGGVGAYAFNIVRSNAGASYIYDIDFKNDECDSASESGWFLQRTFNAVIENSNCNAGGTAQVNADSTNFDTQLIGDFFGSGATVTNSSGPTAGDITEMIFRNLQLGNGTGGSVLQQCPTSGSCGTPVITWGSGTGTPAVTASAPLGINTATGNATCATCVTSSSPGAGIAHFAGSTQAVTSSLIVAADITSATITGTQLAASLALTTPNIGAATGTSLLLTGLNDGTAPVIVTTGTTGTPGATYNHSYTFNEEATAGTGVNYTLPTAAAGKQYCAANAYNGSAANTGVITITTSASGQFIIFTDGTLSATGGNITSGGAAGDAACVVGVDATHWYLYVQAGTWTKH
jgi:hypothetical protein